ncbi:MAG: hypothetical protein M5R36_05950 [Deltaproteobacteria bacterium]|nr:hypothetical protein [Deltaproteobacteria bacterium]
MRRYAYWLLPLAVFLVPLACADYGDDDSLTGNQETGEDDDDGSPDDEHDTGKFSHLVITHAFPDELSGIATGRFDRPAFRYDDWFVDERYAHVLNFQRSPMMPPSLRAEPTNGPLVLYSDAMDVIVFSPMNGFFASYIDYEPGRIQSGVAGEVDKIPAGWEHRFVVVQGHGIADTLEFWGKVLRGDRGKEKVDRYADVGASYLGYWTDNGAYYYYNTEPGMNEQETLLAVRDDAEARGLPYGYMQLDSWWYFKEPGLLSPGGLIRWEPQPWMFPDGLVAFQNELGLPLILHNRWFAKFNDYKNDFPFYFDDPMALPLDRGVYDIFMADAASWGAVTYEQDWLMSQYLGVKWLREGVANGETWMRWMDDAAKDAGLTMQLCMTGGAHLMASVDLASPTTVRTSIDYRQSVSKESYWPQFHTVNMVAWALGLLPFKDNFWSSEKYGEAEALISALSAGMVGPGDRAGKADREILLRTCREDGLLLKPDRPALPIDAMFLPHTRPFTTHAWSDRNGRRWHYVAAYHLASEHPQRTAIDRIWALVSYGLRDVGSMFVFPEAVNDFRVDLTHDLDETRAVIAYNWRTGEAKLVNGLFWMEPFGDLYDFGYYVLAPVLENGLALIGEPDKFVTMADRRFAKIDVDGGALRIELEGAPGETVRLLAFDAEARELLPEREVTLDASGRASVTMGH